MSIRLPFFKKKRKPSESPSELELENIPEHVAIIMDGNGRWAKKRGLPRIAGHKEGMNVVKKIVKAATRHNIKVLTLYAFSTENWKRPKAEVDFLLKLPRDFLQVYLPEMIENNVRIQTIGEFDALPNHTKEAILNGIEQTKHNDGLLLNFALNYGSRYEILRAVKALLEDAKQEGFSPENLDDAKFAEYLYTEGLPDPDLVIRTSGEKRLSNFLLWQAAYSELWFTKKLWPDFTEEIFTQALLDYQQRKRRYGGI